MNLRESVALVFILLVYKIILDGTHNENPDLFYCGGLLCKPQP